MGETVVREPKIPVPTMMSMAGLGVGIPLAAPAPGRPAQESRRRYDPPPTRVALQMGSGQLNPPHRSRDSIHRSRRGACPDVGTTCGRGVVSPALPGRGARGAGGASELSFHPVRGGG